MASSGKRPKTTDSKLSRGAIVWVYNFTDIHKPVRKLFNPAKVDHEYDHAKKLLIIQGNEYEQVYHSVRDDCYYFVRLVKKEDTQRASTMRADSVHITKATVPAIRNEPARLDIKFDKLLPNAYAFVPDYATLSKTIDFLVKSFNAESVLKLNEEWSKTEQVKFTKELERTEIFFEELEKKIDDRFEVIHEYGQLGRDTNRYSLCGGSNIDIVILNKNAKAQKGEAYIAGAVIEMKTCSKIPHRLREENEAQTAFEMMKLGTDKFIQDVLRQGNIGTTTIIVFGILVDMKLGNGLLMRLELNLMEGVGRCFSDTGGTIPLEDVFQLIREHIYM